MFITNLLSTDGSSNQIGWKTLVIMTFEMYLKYIYSRRFEDNEITVLVSKTKQKAQHNK